MLKRRVQVLEVKDADTLQLDQCARMCSKVHSLRMQAAECNWVSFIEYYFEPSKAFDNTRQDESRSKTRSKTGGERLGRDVRRPYPLDPAGTPHAV